MRLQRVGRKNNPSYRVLVVDSHQGPKSGKFVDNLGSYDPKVDRIQLDAERVKEWISKGVQLSDTMHNMLVGQKIIEGKKINNLPRKSPIKKEGSEEVAPEAKEEAPAQEEVSEPAPAEEVAQSEAPVEEVAPAEAKEETPEVEEQTKEETPA